MSHDILNGDNELGRKSSKEALDSNFPLYAYTEKEIKEISNKGRVSLEFPLGLKIIKRFNVLNISLELKFI